MRRGRLAVCLGLAVALLVSVAPAAAQTGSVKLTPFGGQTFSSPYYVTGAPGDPSRVFVVEGAGTIRLVKNGVTQPTPFLNIPEVYKPATGCDDCGLFSMALAPDYATSGRFYVFYTRDAPDPQQHYLRIEEYRRMAANHDVADPASRRIVLEIPHLAVFHHNGGQLQFGPDGLLYASVGDGAEHGDPTGNAQNSETLLGKLIRINPTGTTPFQYSSPADNPFAGPTPGRDEIYSSGFRNPWRFSFDRLTGDLMIGDVGFSDWEEIDFMPSGTGRSANFGWPCFEGSHPLSATPEVCATLPSQTPPVLEYPHPATGGASVTGGYVIRDGALPSLLGRYIYGDSYNGFGGQLRTAQLFAGGSSGDSGLGVSAPGVVSFGEDACAHIYIARFGGAVDRLQPTSGSFPCMPQTSGGSRQPPTAICAGKATTISGTEGGDRLRGTPRNDVIAGLGGNDTILGFAGNDSICGGSGKDTLKGGKGNDRLYGQGGKDGLRGGPGKDKLKGGAAKDKVVQ
jgi:glucose/arabinose dehydrogenase